MGWFKDVDPCQPVGVGLGVKVLGGLGIDLVPLGTGMVGG